MPTSNPNARPARSRIIGVIYLLYFLTAILSVVASPAMIVSNDATATATNLLDHENAVRLGFAFGLISNALYLTLTALFYRLFQSVNQTLSLVAALFGLTGCVVQIVASTFQLAPFVVLRDAATLGVLDPGQLGALAGFCLRLQTLTADVALVFFGVYCLLIGHLVIRSHFLPRILGALMILAGVGWLTFLWPPFASRVANFTLPLGFVAELTLMLWLLVKGTAPNRTSGLS